VKIDQIAYYCSNMESEYLVKELLGLTNKIWIYDTVTARSSVWGKDGFGENVALLQFNYDLGIELEIIRYIKGDHWHRRFLHDYPFISHVGIHLDDHEEFPAMEGAKLAQETFTLKHTSEYLTTGPGRGRKYHYKIFEIAPRNYIKYIKRMHPS